MLSLCIYAISLVCTPMNPASLQMSMHTQQFYFTTSILQFWGSQIVHSLDSQSFDFLCLSTVDVVCINTCIVSPGAITLSSFCSAVFKFSSIMSARQQTRAIRVHNTPIVTSCLPCIALRFHCIGFRNRNGIYKIFTELGFNIHCNVFCLLSVCNHL